MLSSPEKLFKAIGYLEQIKNDSPVVVVSGSAQTEKELLDIAISARDQSQLFAERISTMEKEFLDLTRAIIPITQQSAILSFVKQRFNALEDLCKGIQLLGELPEKTAQEIVHFASLLSSFLFASATNEKMGNTTWTDIRDLLMVELINGSIVSNEGETRKNIQEKWGTAHWGIHVISGGSGRDHKGNTIYFGKGGAELSAAFIAGAVKASEMEIWASGYAYTTADPRWVKNAKVIPELTYEEAIELTQFENNAISPSALNTAIRKSIPIQVRHLEEMHRNHTLIHHGVSPKTEMITGISSTDNVALISIEGSGMIGVPGFAKRVFASLNDASINVVLISQGSSEHSICVAVHGNAVKDALQKLQASFETEIVNGILQPIKTAEDASIVALVGENMKSHPGISGRMFSALGRNGINVLAIAQGSNERNISAVIGSGNRIKAINVLHEAFFEGAKKELNLFIVGTGNVGKKLIEQVRRQTETIAQLHRIKMNVVGICNSRKMTIDQEGIDLHQWQEQLAAAETADPLAFAEKMIALNLRNSVLMDITANALIPSLYAGILKKSMSVVACNKIAASDAFLQYKTLKDLAVSYNCKFLFETNVGAALPVIGTLNDIIKSGDRIHKIEAVLSGTLNYVFNNYDGIKSFSSVVKDAQNEGFTEPDPRLDLSGKDVMRKIMILAREAGIPMEMSDIQCNGFLPESCMNGGVEDFYKEMLYQEEHFKSLLDKANSNNSKLKFVACLENGKASVGLQHIKPESEMYHLYGKDNIVLFYTDRYAQQPLVIKGAGAGAEVTASGVFADALRTINN